MNESMTKVFVEQPLALPGSANYTERSFSKDITKSDRFEEKKPKDGEILFTNNVCHIWGVDICQ